MDIKKILRAFPEVQLAYQFGSSVKRKNNRYRDVDVAILLREGVSVDKRFEVQTTLAERLQRCFQKPIDVSILNLASPLFIYQVLKYGKLIYGQKTKAKEFLVAALTRYFDYLPLHQFFVQHLQKKLGVGHG